MSPLSRRFRLPPKLLRSRFRRRNCLRNSSAHVSGQELPPELFRSRFHAGIASGTLPLTFPAPGIASGTLPLTFPAGIASGTLPLTFPSAGLSPELFRSRFRRRNWLRNSSGAYPGLPRTRFQAPELAVLSRARTRRSFGANATVLARPGKTDSGSIAALKRLLCFPRYVPHLPRGFFLRRQGAGSRTGPMKSGFYRPRSREQAGIRPDYPAIKGEVFHPILGRWWGLTL